MKNIFIFIIILLTYLTCSAQSSDFITVKKNDRTIRSYFAGSNITFGTALGNYSGKIISIKNDSVFINQYDIRQMPTNLGVYVLDTVAVYHLAFNYNTITKLDNTKKGFNWAGSGASLLGGGILLTTIGLGTWIFTKPGTRYHANTGLVVGSAALGAVGYLILKSNGKGIILGKKYTLEYIKVK